MKKVFIITEMLIILMVPSLLFAECMNYEPDFVSLTGKLIRKTFPGPPNYENIKTGDGPETYWILILTKSFCVNAKTNDSLYSSGSGIKQVQLVVMGNEYQKYKTFIGKNVIVHGQLFPMQTGHHHTRVLITVKDIQKDKK